MNDAILSVIRTLVPYLVSTGLLALGKWAGVEVAEDLIDNLGLFATALVAAGYYAVARFLESRWPWVGWLLGAAKRPTYAGDGGLRWSRPAPPPPHVASLVPDVGRVVHYTLSAQDVSVISQQRTETRGVGNSVAEGQTYPAVVVRTFGGAAVNLQVLLDGRDTYWATSRGLGDHDPGTWSWPLRT